MKILFILLFLPIFSFSQVSETCKVSVTIINCESIKIDSLNKNHLIFNINTNYDMIINYDCDTIYIPFSLNKDVYLKENPKSITIIYN